MKRADSTQVSQTAISTAKTETHIDTSKSTSQKVTQTQSQIVTTDTSGTVTTITPIDGSEATIDKNGVLHIKAKDIVVKRKNGMSTNTIVNSHVQEQAGEIKGISDSKTTDSSVVKKDSVHVKEKDKKVDAKPSYGAWPWVIGLVILLLGIGFVLYKKYF